MKCLYVMDPIELVDPFADTTIAMMLAAARRGHSNYYCLVGGLTYEAGTARASCWPVEIRRQRGDHFTRGDQETLDLGAFDMIFMRKDPPVDMAYLHATYVLGRAPESTRVFNEPEALRACNEKLYTLQFSEHMPRTIVSQSSEELLAFVDAVGGEAVIKPVEGRGGEGVFFLSRADRNYRVIIESLTQFGTQFVLAQQFIPDVLTEGDKRLIVIDGVPRGAVMRRPAAGDFRSNVHVGGGVVASEVDDRDRAICRTLGPDLRARGILFAGLDVIGGYLTEINITSPTLVQEIAELSGIHLEDEIIAAAEKRFA